MKTEQTPLERLRYHVTGAIERGEATPIVEQGKDESVHTPDWTEQPHSFNEVIRQRDELLAACKRVLDVITGDQAAELGIYDAIAKAEGSAQ